MVAPSPLLQDPKFLADLRGTASSRVLGRQWGISMSAIVKYRGRLSRGEPLVRTATVVVAPADAPGYRFSDDGDTIIIQTRPTAVAQTITDIHNALRDEGVDPDDYDITVKLTKWENGAVEEDGTLRVLHYGSATCRKRSAKERGAPAWPVIQPAPSFIVPRITRTPRATRWKTAVLGADTQVGYRILDDGTRIPFHDEAAIDVFLQITAAEQPDLASLLGDIIDLPSQSRWAQEASFGKTTQPAIDRVGLLAAQMRHAVGPDGKIVWIEGNHDKRMQNYVETNALAAFGLRRANLPDEWPVMSLPNLLRLDEYDIQYQDAYPAAHYWVNDRLRLEHGTKANSKGSTASQYANETPHIFRAHGHTHRLEVQSKTTFDRLGAVRGGAINPGCLCRVDGAVPSVHGAIHADGKPAEVHEDWQQGTVVIRYREGDEFFVDGVVQIIDGRTVYRGQEFVAAESAAA